MTKRTQEAGVFLELLADTKIVEVINSHEEAHQDFKIFMASCRLMPGYREIHFVDRIAVPLIKLSWRLEDVLIVNPRKEWTTKMVENVPKVAYSYVVEVAIRTSELYEALEKMSALFSGDVAAPPASPETVANARPQTDEDRQRTIASLPDEIIERPLPGVTRPDRNRPAPIPSKYPEISGKEYITGAGATGYVGDRK